MSVSESVCVCEQVPAPVKADQRDVSEELQVTRWVRVRVRVRVGVRVRVRVSSKLPGGWRTGFNPNPNTMPRLHSA